MSSRESILSKEKNSVLPLDSPLEQLLRCDNEEVHLAIATELWNSESPDDAYLRLEKLAISDLVLRQCNHNNSNHNSNSNSNQDSELEENGTRNDSSRSDSSRSNNNRNNNNRQ